MIVNAKNKDFNIDVYLENKNVYRAFAMSEQNEEMGYIIFKAHEKYSWIYRIETNDEFENQGVGSALLTTMEYILLTKVPTCYSIEGEFYPLNSHAQPFYRKHGYTIYKSNSEYYVSKILSKNDLPKIEQQIKSPLNLKPWTKEKSRIM